MEKIPFIDLKRSYEVYKEEIEKKVLEVLRSGIYLNGPQTQELENLLAKIFRYFLCCWCFFRNRGSVSYFKSS
uniref:Transcriptional regulator n=1 Tax=Thermodesulfobacterium geofontis TaxID=1295609 RepID=A0A7C4JPW5_9BACT